ncbi:MAG: hypothetical protein R3B05_20330 [Nitrospira sp.]
MRTMGQLKTGGTFARINVPPALASACYNANRSADGIEHDC